jgi:hypothetical protein
MCCICLTTIYQYTALSYTLITPHLSRELKEGRGNAQWGSNYSPEERPYLRHALATKRKHKVRVTDDFSDGPGNQHGRVGERVFGGFGEWVRDAPDEEESACDLHQGCEERGADEACVGVSGVMSVGVVSSFHVVVPELALTVAMHLLLYHPITLPYHSISLRNSPHP